MYHRLSCHELKLPWRVENEMSWRLILNDPVGLQRNSHMLPEAKLCVKMPCIFQEDECSKMFTVADSSHLFWNLEPFLGLACRFNAGWKISCLPSGRELDNWLDHGERQTVKQACKMHLLGFHMESSWKQELKLGQLGFTSWQLMFLFDWGFIWKRLSGRRSWPIGTDILTCFCWSREFGATGTTPYLAVTLRTFLSPSRRAPV